MRRAAQVGLTLVLAVGGPLSAADDPRTIIQRAVKAMGGEEKLSLQVAQTMKFKARDLPALPGDLTMEGEISSHTGGKHRFEAKIKILGQTMDMAEVVDGKEGWRCQDGKWQKMSAEEIANHQASDYPEKVASLIALLRNKEFKLEMLPETVVAKKPVFSIKVTRQGKPDVSLFFEKETGLLCKFAYKRKTGNKEEQHETILSDYRELDWIGQTEQTLKAASLKAEPAQLLDLLRSRTPTADQLQRVRLLIKKLADDAFEIREQAQQDLVKLGPVALPALQIAAKDDDAEVARRAQESLKLIQEQHNPTTLKAAIRLLGLRRSAGAVEALLNYLPGAEKAVADEVRVALLAFVEAPGGPPAALVKALEDREPARKRRPGPCWARMEATG